MGSRSFAWSSARVAALALPLALPLASTACGSKRAATVPPVAPVALAAAASSGGADGAASFAPFPMPPAPPPAKLPPQPSVVASRKSDLAPRPGARECLAAPGASSGIGALAKACAGSTMTTVGASFSGTQDGPRAPQSFPLSLEGGRCYRVLAVVAPGVRAVDLVVRDSDGAVMTEELGSSGARAAPAAGVFCLKSPDKATVVVGVGEGAGAYTLQLMAEKVSR